MPLGIMEEASWEQGIETITPGGILIAYTDGVTEAQNESEEFYGEARLVEVIESKARHSAQQLQGALEQNLKEFTGKGSQLDDMTLMVVKRN